MIDGLKPYPAMKDSGVPWLGEVPESWKVLRAKYLVREVDERSATGLEELLSVSHKTGVTPRSEKNVTMFLAESNEGHKLCRPGDVVINTMWAWMAALGVSRHTGLVSPSYGVYRPLAGRTALDPNFMDELLRTEVYRAEYVRRSTGVNSSRLRLYPEQFLRIPIMVPPLGEQAAIARFIHYTDARIRRYIAAKRQLIKLLEEGRQVIIGRAVTRGLDPNVKLKSSVVEWLGNVPEHWAVAALRHRYAQVLGKMLDTKRITGAHLVPYLRNTDVQWDRINTTDLPTMDISPQEYERYTVRPDDLLVCEGGEVGRCAIWSDPAMVCGFQKALHRLRPLDPKKDVPRFMYFALHAAAKADAFSDGHVSTIAHLTGEKLRGHAFAYPPPQEQASIVGWLDTSLTNIDRAAESAAREIALLREYRARLIADLVTGKLDVREAAAKLPDVAEEPSALDESEDVLQDDAMAEELDDDAQEEAA